MATDLGTIGIEIDAGGAVGGVGSQVSPNDLQKSIQGALEATLGRFGGAGSSLVGSVFGAAALGKRQERPAINPLSASAASADFLRAAASPIAKLVKVLGVIAIAGVAIGAIGIVGKKVVNTMFKMTDEIVQLTTKYAGLNADLAQFAAELRVAEVLRNIRSAQNVAPFVTGVGRQAEEIKDLLQPVKDAVIAIKSIVVSEFLVLVKDFVGNLRLLFVGVTEILPIVNAALKFRRIVGELRDPTTLLKLAFGGNPLAGIAALLDETKKQNEALDQMVIQLAALNNSGEAKAINDYFIGVGSSLTGGQFNP